MRDRFSVSELCEALGVSRSGYLAACKRAISARERANSRLLEEIRSIHQHRHTRAYGSPRMSRELRARGHNCSENRVARLMRRHALRARPRRPFRPRTTSADHAACPSPNLLAQTDPPTAPGTQLVSDITYVPTAEGWLYLTVVLDLHSRFILGWSLSDSLGSHSVVTAIRRALQSGIVASGALFHSDRGCQFTSAPVRELLRKARLRQSMSKKGDCYDNAFAESCFASLKAELLPDGGSFETHLHARHAIFDYLETFYNRSRRHSSLDYLSPNDFLNQFFQKQNLTLN
jgi:transposase InsO family protein